MNSVASPLRMKMTSTSGLQGARRHRSRHPQTQSNQAEDAYARAQAMAYAQMQAGYGGYAGYTGYPTERAKPHNQPQRPRRHATREPRGRPSNNDEFLAGRPAMIAMNPEDMPTQREHRPRSRPEQRNPKATSGNCRSRATSSAVTRSRSEDRGRSATVGNQDGATKQVTEAAHRPRAAPEQPQVMWRMAVDPKSKRPYYYHPVTRETTWKKPAELVDAEKREKRQFFSVMEHNIRSKLKDGHWLRDSESSTASAQSTPRNSLYMKPGDMSPSRSSASTVSCGSARSSLNGSARSLPGSARQLILNATRSLPTTPEGMGVAHMSDQPQQEPETTDRDSEDELDTGKKRPSLFRTLSSYETPVMTSFRKGSDGVDVDEVGSRASTGLAVPSPIQERVRLASLAPRASDLEAYARAVRAANGKGRPSLQAPLIGATAGRGSSSSALMESRGPGAKGSPRADKPRALRRRSNSTNSIYLRMGTMNAPDQDATIQCVATVLRAHMMEALEAPIRSDPRFDVFVTARDRQRLASIADEPRKDELDSVASAFVDDEDEVLLDVVPTLVEIAKFIKHVFSRAQMESECIIMSLVYVERLLKTTSGSLQLRGENWRRLVFCSMVMASKVWDDLSMTNADFSKIWPELSLKQINELELVYLSAVEYNVRVSAVSYAKYYFHLRSMCATMGLLEAFDESAPLNLDGARKMQVLSEEYQERSKLMPAPRRRSVTITTTSSAEGIRSSRDGCSSARAAKHKATKASPAASLEQLVQMQVRVAGGSSLGSSMHRLSTASTK